MLSVFQVIGIAAPLRWRESRWCFNLREVSGLPTASLNSSRVYVLIACSSKTLI